MILGTVENIKVIFSLSPQHLDLYLEIATFLNQLMQCVPLFLYLSSSPGKAGTRASGLAPSQGLASSEGPADG